MTMLVLSVSQAQTEGSHFFMLCYMLLFSLLLFVCLFVFVSLLSATLAIYIEFGVKAHDAAVTCG